MKTLFISFLLLLFICLNLHAQSNLGTHLTVQYAGAPGTYHVKYIYYRDCSSIPGPLSVPLEYKAAGFDTIITIYPSTAIVPVTTSFCPGFQPINCSGPFGSGAVGIVYETQVTLPFADTAWTFSVSSGYYVATIFGNNSLPNCTEAQLNTLITPEDNLPEFVSPAEFFFCSAPTYNYTQTAIDIDGDSIVYSLVPLYTACGNVPAVYVTPYNYLNFINSSPPISFNSSTGTVSFSPSQIIWGAMNVKATEYRNGTAIGYVTRSTVFEIPWIVSGVDDLNSTAGISVTPVPVISVCTIKAPSFTNASLILYDVAGRVVASKKFNAELIFDAAFLKPGLYLVEIKDAGGRSIKQKLLKD